MSPKTGSKQRLTLIEAARRRKDLAEDKARHILHSVSRIPQNNTGHQEPGRAPALPIAVLNLALRE